MDFNTVYFDTAGPGNTGETLKTAVREAVKRKIPHIVFASTTGATAFAMLEGSRKQGYDGKLVCVSHVYGSRENGKKPISEKDRAELQKRGMILCTAAHVLSGAERCLSRKFSGIYPAEVIAQSLRMLGEGMKVCVEIGAMALDAGLVPFGQQVIATGGTGRGADTVVTVTPAYTNSILDTRIHEILCKPRLAP